MKLKLARVQEIKEIILSQDREEVIGEKLGKYHGGEIADALEQLDKKHRRKVYRILGDQWTSEIFTYLDNVSFYLQELRLDDAAGVLKNMEVDDALDVLEDIDNEDYKVKILSLLDESFFADLRFIASFPEEEIGHHMTTNYITVPADAKITEAMKSVIAQADTNTNVNTIFVVEDNDKYAGAIALKDLIIARKGDDIHNIIKSNHPSVFANHKVSEVIEQLKEYTEDYIPVLNAEKQIIGILTYDDIIEAVGSELGEDYAKLAGMTEQSDLHESIQESMKKRLPWLILLLGLGMLVSGVVGLFEAIVAQLVIIVTFQSLILDMAGNVGTQSLAVTIRVLMDEDISGKTKLGFVVKEVKVGAANGLLLGSLSFVAVWIFLGLIKNLPGTMSFMVAACVGLALFLAIVISSLVGTVVPIFFHKIKVDPAVASGPLITTVSDLVAVVAYYGLAGILLIELGIV